MNHLKVNGAILSLYSWLDIPTGAEYLVLKDQEHNINVYGKGKEIENLTVSIARLEVYFV